jgi:hypothetical protein
MHLALSKYLAIALTLASLCVAPIVQAGAGHDHGDKAAPQAPNAAQPRFAATSDLFELVGVVNGTQLTLYLDRASDNSPVKGATLELELDGTKIDVKPHAEGEFEATLSQPLKSGIVPVTVTVVAGQETDLLAGEIDLREPTLSVAPQARNWEKVAGWTAAGLALLAALGWLVRRASGRHAPRVGGAA